jgi:hypothetical protein
MNFAGRNLDQPIWQVNDTAIFSTQGRIALDSNKWLSYPLIWWSGYFFVSKGGTDETEIRGDSSTFYDSFDYSRFSAGRLR